MFQGMFACLDSMERFSRLKRAADVWDQYNCTILLWPRFLAGHGDQAKLELSLSLSHTHNSYVMFFCLDTFISAAQTDRRTGSFV
jgi:hypothetical protein